MSARLSCSVLVSSSNSGLEVLSLLSFHCCATAALALRSSGWRGELKSLLSCVRDSAIRCTRRTAASGGSEIEPCELR